MRDEVIIHGFVKAEDLNVTPACVGTSNYMYNWKVWKMTNNLNVVFQKPFLEVTKDTKVHFKPFFLNIGVDKLILNVTCWTGSIQSFSFLVGYFQIVELDLEAVISGGKLREICYNDSVLKLDASKSWDPNLSR